MWLANALIEFGMKATKVKRCERHYAHAHIRKLTSTNRMDQNEGEREVAQAIATTTCIYGNSHQKSIWNLFRIRWRKQCLASSIALANEDDKR